MLSKEVDWSILATCDFYAVEKYVQTPDRLAMRAVKPMQETMFRKKLAKEKKWKEAFRTICEAYGNLAPTFCVWHDNFGGYRLVYTGKKPLCPLCDKIPLVLYEKYQKE